MSILSLQTASPDLKNNGFIMEILTFLKNRGFVLEDWFGKMLSFNLGVFWGHIWASGALRSFKLDFEIRAFLGQLCPKKKF